METQNLLFFSLCFFLFSLLTGNQCVQGSSYHHHYQLRHGLYGFQPTKLFVFGDSYADTGNTRIKNSSSWKFPYGITFPGKPTGRFSSGRVLTDYIAKSLGLKTPIAYRWTNYAPDHVQYGINFAYGGTGVFKTLLPGPNMTTQIDIFQSLINNGSRIYNTSDLQSSLALVTLAGNDYSAYIAKGGSQPDLETFINLVVNQLKTNLERIHGMGVKKVAVAALQPLGCLPHRTIENSFQQCNDTDNNAATYHNRLLTEAVANLNNGTNDSPFVILDLYDSFISVLQNKSGSVKFETPLKPCCLGISSEYSCGDIDDKGEKLYTVCENPENAFFWDMYHPTQAGWHEAFLALNSPL
ncbi:hypothetical protein ACSBR1_035973 [Camellia fascicularis]